MDSAIRIPPMPYDLLGPIFEHLKDNKASLCAISLASRTFRQEAQCILFREVTDPIHSNKHLAFLRAVVASPARLALFVHTYGHWEYKMDPHDRVIAEQALKAMCNLKHLSLSGTALLGDNMRILCDCTFSLERFDGSTSTSDAELFESFLPGQNMLKHLGLHSGCYGEETFKLPIGSCLQLVSIAGSWGMIEALLPGRKITTISVSSGGIEINAATVQSLAVELKNISALSVSVIHLMGDSDLPDFSVLQHFPSLKLLELSDLSDPLDLIYLNNSPSLFETLSSLTALRTLILTDTNEVKLDIQLVPRLFAKLCENLKFIDIQDDWETYTRYTKNSKRTEAVSDAEVLKAWLAEPIT